ncbi:MAG TPA: sigma-54 dependent transcriptional regulator [Dissulfurispiraceae bacterium]|nr:sigma-54 dependent transcriptional regulator [Dissulfurispiraceae bacterium]
MDKLKALVIDDEESICEVVREILQTEDIVVDTTSKSVEAISLIEKTNYDIIMSDLKMPDMDGLEIYDRIKELSPDSAFIIITAYGTIQSAVDAVKRGIYDYIQKPFTPDEVRIPVRRALEKKKLERENIALRTQIETRYAFSNIIGSSRQIQEVFRIMRHAATSDSNVLITGETGTGKELVARAIHSNSLRAGKKFVVVNCGLIPGGFMESELFGYVKGAFDEAVSDKRGLIEDANHGTLFLDDITELAPELQVKLLRVIHDGHFTRIGSSAPVVVNLRIISSAVRDMRKLVVDKIFREDLYYRLNIIPIHLPPLREMRDDIPLLTTHFIQKYQSKVLGKVVTGVSKDALQALMNYHFPGNVRELENAIEYGTDFTSGPLIQLEDLPAYIHEKKDISEKAEQVPIMPLKDAKEQLEKGLIMAALIKSEGNISEAARMLKIHRQNLQQKIQLLGIDLTSVQHTR